MTQSRFTPSGAALSRRAYVTNKHRFRGIRQAILELLAKHGALTANQVGRRLSANSELDNKNSRARLSELLEAGVVIIDHVGLCPISGQPVRYYRLPRQGETPTPPPAKPTRAHLLAQIAHLQQQLDRETSRTSEAIDIAANALAELQMLREGRV